MKLPAIWLAKFILLVSKILQRGGSAMPGRFALKLCPNLLDRLASQVPHIVAVCGTNGKTTTNNLCAAIMRRNGKSIVCNDVGANMYIGVVTAFIAAADWRGRIKADYACLEVDELAARTVFKHAIPECVIITNLFSDQLDRYGDVNATVGALLDALRPLPASTHVVLSADDPLMARMGKLCGGRELVERKRVTYVGIDGAYTPQDDPVPDGVCPNCGGTLSYAYRHYADIGRYTCGGCGHANPDAAYVASDVVCGDALSFCFTRNNTGARSDISVSYGGFYNVYNILLATAAAQCVGLSIAELPAIMGDYSPAVGRLERMVVRGKPVVLILSKNPAGFNLSVTQVLGDTRAKDILFAVNDKEPDGVDVSWLWDVEVERLAQANVVSAVCAGMRRDEVRLRLKYADLRGVDAYTASDDTDALERVLSGHGEVVYVLANYTALFPLQKQLREMA